MGERLFTRFDFLPILQQGLADYLMPDVLWTGGITELRKISSLAEAYYIPMSPHNAMGPLQIVAGAHVMMNTPNFYRLEHSTSFIEAYNRLTTEPMNFHGGEFSLSGKSGLGVDFDMEALRAHLHPGMEVRPLEELPTKSTKEKRSTKGLEKAREGSAKGRKGGRLRARRTP